MLHVRWLRVQHVPSLPPEKQNRCSAFPRAFKRSLRHQHRSVVMESVHRDMMSLTLNDNRDNPNSIIFDEDHNIQLRVLKKAW